MRRVALAPGRGSGGGVRPLAPDPGAAPLPGLAAPVALAAHEQLIGVAIPVPSPYADELEAWRARLGDPLATTVPAHVTLVPPTAVDADGLAGVREHLAAAAQATPPFRLALRGTDSFRPVTPVVYVRVAGGADECAALEAQVRSGVLGTRRRFPFHPHVTVAQQLDDDALDRASTALADYAADFTVAALQLYHHGVDGVWRPAARFALGG